MLAKVWDLLASMCTSQGTCRAMSATLDGMTFSGATRPLRLSAQRWEWMCTSSVITSAEQPTPTARSITWAFTARSFIM